MRSPRRSGANLASVGVGRVELLARGRWHAPPPASLWTRIIAVGSTSGRAGKSTVAAHLAVAFANLGAHVIAVDLDPSTPSLHTILGVEPPTLGWQALLNQEIRDLDSSLMSTTIRNLYLVAGGMARPGAATLDRDQRRLLMPQLRALEAEVVILDLCATDHEDLADFFSLAETSLLVTSPDCSSLGSTLAFLGQNARVPLATPPAGAIAAEEGTPTAPPSSLSSSLSFLAKLVGNQASTPEQVEVFHAFSRLVRARLGFDLPVAGCVRAQDRLTRVGPPTRGPLRDVGLDRNGRTFLRMAETLLHEDLPVMPPELEGEMPELSSLSAPVEVERGGNLEIGEEPLAVMLDRFRRKHLRHEVDWAATLRIGAREIAVRVVDVSLSGVALEVAPHLEIGADAILRFDQLPGQPALPVAIKSLQESVRRAGVAFTGPDEERQRLVDIAQAAPEPAPAMAEGMLAP